MRAREFESSLIGLSPWRPSEIDQRTRGLRDAGMLPVGGRGLNAPDIEPQHAAAILLSLAASDRAPDAVDAARTRLEMVPVEGKSPAATQNFATALAAILSDPDYKLKVKRVVVCRTWPEASIEYRGTHGKREFVTYRPADFPKQGYGFAARVDTTLDGGLLHQLAIDLAGLNDDEAGCQG